MDEERVSNHTRSVLDVAQRHGYISSIESVQSKNENNKREAECTHQNVSDDRVAGFARCDDCGARAW